MADVLEGVNGFRPGPSGPLHGWIAVRDIQWVHSKSLPPGPFAKFKRLAAMVEFEYCTELEFRRRNLLIYA